MKITISCGNEKLYPYLAELGYAGLDFGLDYNEEILTDSFRKSLLENFRAAERAGLCAAQTHLPYWPSHIPPIGDGSYDAYEDYLYPRLARGIELTAEMGCRTAVIHMYFEADEEKSRAGNLRMLEKLLPVLEKNRVILSMETIYGPDYSHAFLSSPADLLYYTDRFQSPYLGICLDSGHAVILGQDPVAFIPAVGKKLTALHLHSALPRMDLHTIPGILPNVDYTRIAENLKAVGYEGTFNMEIGPNHLIPESAYPDFYRFAYSMAQGFLGCGI